MVLLHKHKAALTRTKRNNSRKNQNQNYYLIRHYSACALSNMKRKTTESKRERCWLYCDRGTKKVHSTDSRFNPAIHTKKNALIGAESAFLTYCSQWWHKPRKWWFGINSRIQMAGKKSSGKVNIQVDINRWMTSARETCSCAWCALLTAEQID